VTAANRAVIIDAGGDVTADLGDRYEAGALVEWASVTKTVTAAAVLVLLAERDIPRDTPARNLLPVRGRVRGGHHPCAAPDPDDTG